MESNQQIRSKLKKEIKFGTDGWREIIADSFTVENVNRVANATASWLLSKEEKPTCVVGHDCRFGGEMFAVQTALVLAQRGVKVKLAQGFVSTPMISLACKVYNQTAGVIITASHNPPNYNGYKIKANYGGPVSPAEITAVEHLIEEQATPIHITIAQAIQQQLLEYVNIEELYLQHILQNFDVQLLFENQHKLAYDAMYGAGQNVIKKLFTKATLIHCENNPGFEGRAPEPIAKNLSEIMETIANSPLLDCGLATDGDADRIGFFDENGKFIDSHHLILLLIEYLTTHKNFTGKVIKSFSVSDKVDKFCKLKNLETITTKIGFKYICEYMVNEDVLIGAEESGGIAIKGHLPERDGIWMGLVIMEFMAKTGKKVSELIQNIYDKIGAFAVERYDLHISEEQKQKIILACQKNEYAQFDKYTVLNTENIDGYKFRLPNDNWVMIRPSGTEPVLRVYAEAENSEKAFEILDATKATILS